MKLSFMAAYGLIAVVKRFVIPVSEFHGTEYELRV